MNIKVYVALKMTPKGDLYAKPYVNKEYLRVGENVNDDDFDEHGFPITIEEFVLDVSQFQQME